MSDEQLAIFGGAAAKTTPGRAYQRYGDEELAQLKEALEQNSLFYAFGTKTKTLCERFAAMHGRKHCIATSSCTAAIHVAVASLKLQPGDEIITAPITDMGTVLGMLWCQLVPIFADMDPRTFNLDPASVEARITPRTKAILPVHLAGNPCDMNAFRAIAKKYNLALIEDCAQAYLAQYDNTFVGTFGDLGCFSINEYKHISCGDGGLILTDDDELARCCRMLADKGYDRSGASRNRATPFLAINYRMTELQAAVALAQLEKLPGIVEYYRNNYDQITATLQGIPGLNLHHEVPNGRTSAWFYLMSIDEEELGVTRDWFVQALQAEGVDAGAYIPAPVYRNPIFTERATLGASGLPFSLPDVEIGTRYDEGACPHAEQILKTCITFSTGMRRTAEEIQEIGLAFRKVVNYCLNQRKAGVHA